MRTQHTLGALALALAVGFPAAAFAAQPPAWVPVTHEELGRALDGLAAELHGLGQRWRGHFLESEPVGERPLISIMLSHRQDLALTPAQVRELERLRAEFQREVIKRDADLRVAEMDLAALLKTDPVDLSKAEARIREVERLRAELRVGRVRTIEQGKALLTQDQRAKLSALLAESWPSRPPAGSRPAPPPALRPQSL